MFQQIINLLSNGKSYSQHELAEELGISTETLQEYLQYLSERGFLTQVEYQTNIGSNHNKCSSCSNCKGCFGGKFRVNECEVQSIGRE
jgi:DeoR/GlpR family transcriptional regulator of sugar metabolism